MKKTKKRKLQSKSKVISQLRQDLITGDWVVIAVGRSKRPDDFKQAEDESRSASAVAANETECPFCDPEASGQKKDVLIYKTSEGKWTLRVFPNKYPAFTRPIGRKKIIHQTEGPYFWMEGIGYHEVIVTHDHYKHIGEMDPLMVAEILDAYQTRYLDLMNRKSVRYIEIFHNYGKAAGASLAHPHSQLVAVPFVSSYINSELQGAENYFRANGECPYCVMLKWEQEQKERIVFENEHFVAFCPFASRAAFEVWIISKKHQPYFERSSEEDKIAGGEALHEIIKKINRVLGRPAFNFYLHTAPCDGKDYPHYHWHIEVLPKTSTWAGFELSTGVEISTIEPEEAARYLQKQ